MAIFNLNPKVFWIFEISKPPNLNIVGLPIRLIIVDSMPIAHAPPSKIYLILLPNSSLTSFILTALTFVEILALGAASG